MEETKYGWWLPPMMSAHGGTIDQLINILHYFMAILFVGWAIYFAYCLIRFRSRPGHKAEAVHGHFRLPTWIEVGVAIFEVALLVFLSSPVWNKVKNEFPNPKESLIVRIVAEQFAWNIHYPGKDGKFGKTKPELMDGTNPLGIDREDPDAKDDIFTVNNLYVSVAKPVIIYLTSKDVIHSFFLPTMRVKQDAIPGMLIPIWFQPAQMAEDLQIACAQLCGVGHTTMKGQFYVVSQEKFDAWYEEQAKELLANSGADASRHALKAAAQSDSTM